jgi:beta-fructofuranosidase
MRVFYRPTDGFVGDVIPFYWQGAYHAFYLKAPLPPKRNGADGTPYAHVVSRDLVYWEEWPLVVEPGPPGAPDDVSCFTGTVIERDGIFHLFYTGFRGPDLPQTICHATSRDLRTWEKDPRNPLFGADERWYEPIDWRDPFPFWNEEAGEYWMLLAAREKTGPDNRRGCIALATSPDLETWTVKPPFWSPRLYFTHECPDLFRWGEYWVLVYSTFTERHITHYRMSKSLSGPWLAPANDSFDGRAFYAAKTASDGTRRFAFGWNPTRSDETDSGKWDWAGNMVVHELHPGADGAILVKPLPEQIALFTETAALDFVPRFGKWQHDAQSYHAAFTDGFSAATLGSLPDPCRITCRITPTQGTRACGLLLRADDSLDTYYQLRWEPDARRLVIDPWPRPGDVPFMLERPLLEADAITLDVYLEDTAITIYANNAVALTCRGYDHRTGSLGLFVSEGEARFSNVQVYRL